MDAGQWCVIHGEYEPDQPGDYKACGECCHVWRTEQEFIDDVLNAYSEHAAAMKLFHGTTIGPYEGDPRQDPVCPLCTHDF